MLRPPIDAWGHDRGNSDAASLHALLWSTWCDRPERLTAVGVPDQVGFALTVAEIRRLLNAFVLATLLPPEHTLHWPLWRRTSQARARRSHYQRRQAK
ncbi:hypothetical protein DDE19_12360 [Micromonospora ureilytica]|uniref:Uncharacterized protein n=1 Tax=Micromonospora ureilytica TaxID=709868 RepID=A0A3N9XWU7_9ACTN|nr:hypothetical protein DDE19_12360 [Micromonospora ureilytica]